MYDVLWRYQISWAIFLSDYSMLSMFSKVLTNRSLFMLCNNFICFILFSNVKAVADLRVVISLLSCVHATRFLLTIKLHYHFVSKKTFHFGSHSCTVCFFTLYSIFATQKLESLLAGRYTY